MGRYQFRYGDGRASVICMTWNNSGGGGDVDMFEANMSLRPRSGPLSQVQDLTEQEVITSVPGGSPMTVNMDLQIEKVGLPPPDNRYNARRSG